MIIKDFYYKMKAMEKKKKTMELVYKGMQLNYLNTVEKFLSIQNQHTPFKKSHEEELKQLIIEEDEKEKTQIITPKSARSRIRNVYSKDWYEKLKKDKSDNN
jgi:hypothetical protein